MDDTGPHDPTLIMGIHGVFHRHPWLGRVSEAYDLEEDVFSLAVKRAEAYGFSSTHLGSGREVAGQRWAHHDAGGDWTEDGRVREIAWLLVSVAEAPHGQLLPVVPVATVLGDVLSRVGRFRLTGTHTLVPLHLAPDASAALVGSAAWFALADPDGATGLTVTVSARPDAGLSGRADRIRDLALERTYGQLTVEAAAGGSGPAPEGPAPRLTGGTRTDGMRTDGMRQVMAFRCEVRAWSLDVAAWTTEVFTDALRATGTRDPVLITVSGPAV
ncbi:hypothetical protein [Streptomyces sp. NPDC088725]|uniref:hypothetical protein n=1 Tax=Streptomyces sp. NPDC088725 TaxID=3365873 RepID=UPI0037F13938